MRDCPFHTPTRDFPPLMCGMNLALIEGLLDGMGETGLSACLRPRPDHHLAQLNVGPLDAPGSAGFVAGLKPINALADGAPGIVWRLTDERGEDATSIHPNGDDVIVNLPVWESRQSLWNFAYRSDHLDPLRRRREWFVRMAEPIAVPWWVPAGHIPSVEEALGRLDRLREKGPGPAAFTFRDSYDPAGLAT